MNALMDVLTKGILCKVKKEKAYIKMSAKKINYIASTPWHLQRRGTSAKSYVCNDGELLILSNFLKMKHT